MNARIFIAFLIMGTNVMNQNYIQINVNAIINIFMIYVKNCVQNVARYWMLNITDVQLVVKKLWLINNSAYNIPNTDKCRTFEPKVRTITSYTQYFGLFEL